MFLLEQARAEIKKQKTYILSLERQVNEYRTGSYGGDYSLFIHILSVSNSSQGAILNIEPSSPSPDKSMASPLSPSSPSSVSQVRTSRKTHQSPVIDQQLYLCPISRKLMKDPVVAEDGTKQISCFNVWIIEY
jgi:hypothetical protein